MALRTVSPARTEFDDDCTGLSRCSSVSCIVIKEFFNTTNTFGALRVPVPFESSVETVSRVVENHLSECLEPLQPVLGYSGCRVLFIYQRPTTPRGPCHRYSIDLEVATIRSKPRIFSLVSASTCFSSLKLNSNHPRSINARHGQRSWSIALGKVRHLPISHQEYFPSSSKVET